MPPMKRAVLLLFLTLSAVPAFATTYYTAKDCTGGSSPPNCNNANNGTSRQTAELTIAAGLAHLSAGDTLIVGNGTYDAQIVNGVPSGSAGAPTIIMAENRRQAILSPSSPGGLGVIELTGNIDYVTFDGFVLDCINVADNDCFTQDGTVGSFPDHITAQHLTIHDGTTTPSFPTSAASGVSIALNGHSFKASTFNTYFDLIITDMGHAGHGHCVYFSSGDNVVHDVTCTNIQGYGVQIYNSSPGVDRNTAYNITCNNCGTSTNGTAAFLLSGGTGHVLYNSIAYNGCDGVQVNYSAVNAVVYSNTFYSNTDCANPTFHVYSGVTGTLIKNNISYANTDNTVFNEGTSTSATNNLIGTNPLFTNAAGADFTLTSLSPAIGNGTTYVTLGAPYNIDKVGTFRPTGAGYDAGAYEFNSGAVTPICAFSVCDMFDTYPTSSNLSGFTGGEGWAGPWSQGSGSAVTVVAAPAGGQGGNAVLANAESSYTRTFTPTAASSHRVLLRWSAPSGTANSGLNYKIKDSSTGGILWLGIDTGGDIVMWDGMMGANVKLLDVAGSDVSKNVWYTLDVEFDDAAHADQFRARVNLGAWSAWTNIDGVYTTMDTIEIEDDATNTHSFWVDGIGGSPAVTTSVPLNLFSATRLR